MTQQRWENVFDQVQTIINYQRQRPSVGLVTASKPTPSYHMTERD